MYAKPVTSRDELSLSGAALPLLLQAVLDKGVPFRFEARGFSMLPYIRNGDVITVSPLLGMSVRLGDIVAFLHPDRRRLVVHRVVERRASHLVLKGDNLAAADGLIPDTRVMGRVTRVERNGAAVRLGLGPERRLINLIGRGGPLVPVLLPVWKLVRRLVRGWRNV